MENEWMIIDDSSWKNNQSICNLLDQFFGEIL